MSLQQIRVAVAQLVAYGVDDLAQLVLMSDGSSVYLFTSDDQIIDLLLGGQGVFGIALGRVWRELEGSLSELPTSSIEDAGTGIDELAERRAKRRTAV